MKKVNLLVMSLVSAAALSFTSCSSNDDLAGNAGQEKVDGFYMTLSVQTPTSNGTRTVVNTPTEYATEDEAAITKGTLYLVDADKNIVFSENLSDLDWTGQLNNDENSKKDGNHTFKIEVKNVEAGKTYNVYFKAGDQEPTAAMNFNPTLSNIFAFGTDDKFATTFSSGKNFAMFNQNDSQVNGNGYTVKFIQANNNEQNPAKVYYDGNAGVPIKVERVVARIDAPEVGSTQILANEPADASAALKVAIADAKKKVDNITLVNYAVANLANKSYVMQTWNSDKLVLPNDISYAQKTTDFGGTYDYKDGGFDNTTNKPLNYVFENYSEGAPTTMYFEYQVTLKESEMTNADFKDGDYKGTFYRYNNVIYTSFAQIFEDYKGVTELFGKDETSATMKTKLEAAIGNETELGEFRHKYNIEVFKGGKTYYKYVIKDKFIGYDKAIQRNSIYHLKINNIFNVGAQVPNGEVTENEFYYLNVTVTVNPWVLNEEDVNLQ